MAQRITKNSIMDALLVCSATKESAAQRLSPGEFCRLLQDELEREDGRRMLVDSTRDTSTLSELWRGKQWGPFGQLISQFASDLARAKSQSTAGAVPPVTVDDLAEYFDCSPKQVEGPLQAAVDAELIAVDGDGALSLTRLGVACLGGGSVPLRQEQSDLIRSQHGLSPRPVVRPD